MAINILQRTQFQSDLEYNVAVLSVLTCADSDSIFYYFEYCRRSVTRLIRDIKSLVIQLSEYLQTGESYQRKQQLSDFGVDLAALRVDNLSTVAQLVRTKSAELVTAQTTTVSKQETRIKMFGEILYRITRLYRDLLSMSDAEQRFLGSGLHLLAVRSILLGNKTSGADNDARSLNTALALSRIVNWSSYKYSGPCMCEDEMVYTITGTNSLPLMSPTFSMTLTVGEDDYEVSTDDLPGWTFRHYVKTYDPVSTTFPTVSASHQFSFILGNALITVSLGTVVFSSLSNLAFSLNTALSSYDISVSSESNTLIFAGSQTGYSFRFRLPPASGSSVNTLFDLFSVDEVRGAVITTLPPFPRTVNLSTKRSFLGQFEGDLSFVDGNTVVSSSVQVEVGAVLSYNGGYYRVISSEDDSFVVDGTVILPYNAGFVTEGITFSLETHILTLSSRQLIIVSDPTELSLIADAEDKRFRSIRLTEPTNKNMPLRVGDVILNSSDQVVSRIKSFGDNIVLQEAIGEIASCKVLSGSLNIFTQQVASASTATQTGALFYNEAFYIDMADRIRSSELGTEIAETTAESLRELYDKLDNLGNELSIGMYVAKEFSIQISILGSISPSTFELLTSLRLRQVFHDTEGLDSILDRAKSLFNRLEPDTTVIAAGARTYGDY